MGNYRFTDVSTGNYTVAFEYDGKEYMAAKYKLANVVESENSDAIESEEGLAVTDIINITDKDVETKINRIQRIKSMYDKLSENYETYNDTYIYTIQNRGKVLNKTLKL